MGCDYYHEAIRPDIDDEELSDEPGELELVVKVYHDSDRVETKSVTVDVPVGGKVYLDRLKSENVWAR